MGRNAMLQVMLTVGGFGAGALSVQAVWSMRTRAPRGSFPASFPASRLRVETAPQPASPHPASPHPTPTPLTAPPPLGEDVSARDPHLTTLITSYIGTADLVRGNNDVLWERIATALTRIGVETVIPDGLPFDGDQYEAVDRRMTDDPSMHLTVASTDLAGYRDGDSWIRRPQTVVYRLNGS